MSGDCTPDRHTAEQFREAADMARGLAAKAAERGEQDQAKMWRVAAEQLEQAAAVTPVTAEPSP